LNASISMSTTNTKIIRRHEHLAIPNLSPSHNAIPSKQKAIRLQNGLGQYHHLTQVQIHPNHRVSLVFQ
jgi:hypothetical protein